jgi:hypothetical protein
MNAGPQHVIFWTGAIGLATLDALRRRGETARLVNRSGTALVPDDIEVLGGDASDPAFIATAAHGAQVVYQAVNPPYHQWVELFPALQASVLAGAQASGARRTPEGRCGGSAGSSPGRVHPRSRRAPTWMHRMQRRPPL